MLTIPLRQHRPPFELLGEKLLGDLIGQPQALLPAQLGPGLRCQEGRRRLPAGSHGLLAPVRDIGDVILAALDLLVAVLRGLLDPRFALVGRQRVPVLAALAGELPGQQLAGGGSLRKQRADLIGDGRQSGRPRAPVQLDLKARIPEVLTEPGLMSAVRPTVSRFA